MLNSDVQIAASRQMYGTNVLSKPKRDSLLKQYISKFEDPVIRILLIAVVATMLLGHFVEGTGIIIAILLATGIGFINEYRSQKNFDILNSSSDDVLYKAYRYNKTIVSLKKKDILVGDEIELSAGEEIPADCIIINCENLTVDESAFTGESVPVEKLDYDDCEKHSYKSNFLLRGSKIQSGICYVKVVSIGDATIYGSISHDSQIDNGIETPLNKQLNVLADKIGVYGTLVAFITFFALSIKHIIGMEVEDDYVICIITMITIMIASLPITMPSLLKLFKKEKQADIFSDKLFWISSIIGAVIYFIICYFLSNMGSNPNAKIMINDIVNYFMIAITIIVVAVPEGLPMATTLSLAYSIKKMFKENNLVRKMHACETTGACTVVLSDKTGTLTRNRMDLSYSAAGNTVENDSSNVAIQALYNSTVDIDSEGEIIGNPTEGAMLLHVLKNKPSTFDYRKERKAYDVIERKLFNSIDKYMSTTIECNENKTTLYKGAPEIVLAMCNIVKGAKIEDPGYATIVKSITSSIELAQNSGKRVIMFAISHNIGEIKYDGFCVIKDPVRLDVPDSIRKSIRAGIKPVIVTGDNHLTAIHIGREIGLINKNDNIKKVTITGEQMSQTSDNDLKLRLKDLKVVSRAKPDDKQRLVRLFQETGEVVAVTGDGSNDAPALKRADVGLSMGSGTAIAKEASDIVLINNSFSSFITAVKWGRSIYLNIQHFLVFQLTINVAALFIAMIGPFIGIEMPFTVIQMLWINLIMDTFAALALATEPPKDEVLLQKPRNNNSFILNKSMLRYIFGIGFIQVVFFIFILFDIKSDGVITPLEITKFFNLFVFINLFGLLNVRNFEHFNVFKGIKKSVGFVIIFFIILIGQILITEYGGTAFRTVSLSLHDYVTTIAKAFAFMMVCKIGFHFFNKK